MIFKDRKIPRHLIIREEYELRRQSRLGPLKVMLVALVVAALAFMVSAGMIAW